MTLIGLNGKAGAGKDTFADILERDYGFTKYSFAKALKDAVLALDPIVDFDTDDNNIRLSSFIRRYDDWDWAKRDIPEVRRLLQQMGTEVGRQILGSNVWVDIVKSQWIADGAPDGVITDMRFENEVEFVTSHGGTTVLIERKNNPHAIPGTHASEQLSFVPDLVVYNDGTLEDLSDQAFRLVNDIALFSL